LSGVLQVRL